VVPLRNHLRAHENRAVGEREPLERGAELIRLRDGVGVEPDPLELGDVALELALEPLRPGSDPRELGGAALGARLAGRLPRVAVMAAETAVPMQRERDVTVRATAGDSAGAAVKATSQFGQRRVTPQARQ
jgi:hypothetical protein